MELLCDVCFVDIVDDKIIICFNNNCKKAICKNCILNSIYNNIYNFKCYHCYLKINNNNIKKIFTREEYTVYLNYTYDRLYSTQYKKILDLKYNIIQGKLAIENLNLFAQEIKSKMIKCMIYDMLHNTYNFTKINKILIDCMNIIENYNDKFYYSLILKDSINLLKYSIPNNVEDYMNIKQIVKNIKYKLLNNKNYKLYTLTECYKCENVINNYYCIKCDQMTCMSCGISYEYNTHADCENNNGDEYIQDENIKKCPGCYIDIYKDEGCKIMWCVICKVHFNWDTLKIINKTHNPNFNNYARDNILKYNKALNNVIIYKKIPSQLRNSIIRYFTKTINKTNELSIESYINNSKKSINYAYINDNNINTPRYMFKIINEFIINLSKSTHIISDNNNIDSIIVDYINNKIDKIKFKKILINKNNIQEFDKKARNIALNCYHEYIILLNIIKVYNTSFNDILQLYYIYFANIYNLMKIYGIKKSKFMFNVTIDKHYTSNNAVYILTILYNNTYNKLCIVKNINLI